MTLGIAWILSALLYGWEEEDSYRTWSQQGKDGVSSMDFVAVEGNASGVRTAPHRTAPDVYCYCIGRGSWTGGRRGHSHPAQWWAALEKHMSPTGRTVVLPPWPGLY